MNHNVHPNPGPLRRTAAFTLVEALVAIAIFGIGASILAINLRPFAADVESQSVALAATLTQVRTKAMATTSAFRATSAGDAVVVERSSRCDATDWTVDPSVDLDLEHGFSFDETWWVCFDSRGRRRTASSETITVTDTEGRSASVRVLLGGVVVR